MTTKKAIAKKYYLVTYIFQPAKGTPVYPNMSKMYEFDDDMTPLECYEQIQNDLNKDGQVDDEWRAYRCGINNMVRVE